MQEDACTLTVNLSSPEKTTVDNGSDDEIVARAVIKFQEADHVTVWSNILQWAVDAKVQHTLRNP
jgi:hypothetical protein